MLERETELIQQIILESTIRGRQAIRLNELAAADVPRGVKAYIIADVNKLLEKELEQSPLARISKGVASTITSQRSILRSLAMEYTLQREEYLKIVEDTVHFLENYLCRPRWTLQQLMFEHSQQISFEEMAKKLELAVEYSYFGILIERHARRAGWKEISATQFSSLVERIDDEIVKKHSPRELALLARPIYDFLLFGDNSMDRPVPVGAILLFFEDKKLLPVKEYIERIYQLRPHKHISLNELIAMIEELHSVAVEVEEDVEEAEKEILAQREPAVASEVAPPVPEPVTEQVEKAVEPAVEEEPEIEHLVEPERVDILSTLRDDISPTTGMESMPQAVDALFIDATVGDTSQVDATRLDTTQAERDTPWPEEQKPAVVDPNILAGFAKERSRLRDVIMNFPETPPKPEFRAELLDVEDSFTVDQRAKFIKRVFKSNEADYAVFINSVNKANTWREAQVHLKQLFEIKNLDVLSPDVVEFTDAMHTRFNPGLTTE